MQQSETGVLALLFYFALAEWNRGPVPTVPPMEQANLTPPVADR